MNKQPITITGTIPAWLTGTHYTLDKVMREEKDPAELLSRLGFSNYDMDSGSHPWVKVGSAEITVTLFPQEEVVAEQVKVLNAELQRERAESQVRQNGILDRISKLQALSFDGEVTA